MDYHYTLRIKNNRYGELDVETTYEKIEDAVAGGKNLKMFSTGTTHFKVIYHTSTAVTDWQEVDEIPVT